MPKTWFYHIALVLPLAFRILILNTGFVDWLWYQHYEHAYYALAALKVQPQFVSLIGNWALPVFILTVICWWYLEDGEGMTAQFLLLPLGYIPFTIIADMLANSRLDQGSFFVYPLIILPVGYAYVFCWMILMWLLDKLGLVVS